MPFKFGVSASDNVLFNGQVSTTLQLASRVILQMGWFYPTTLTAGRYLMSSAGTHGIKIDTTTTSLRIVADYATTDGEYTAPAGLTVNDWHFVAWLSSWGSTTVNAQKLWVGNGVKGFPTERTVTQAVAPSGALTSGGTSWRLGNDATATSNAFQGDISGAALLLDNNNTEFSAFGFAGNGALSQDQTDLIFRRIVVPYWRNDPVPILAQGCDVVRFSATGPLLGVSIFSSLDNAAGASANGWYFGGTTAGWSPPARATATGATADTLLPPRTWEDTPQGLLVPTYRPARGYSPRVILL